MCMRICVLIHKRYNMCIQVRALWSVRAINPNKIQNKCVGGKERAAKGCSSYCTVKISPGNAHTSHRNGTRDGTFEM